LANGRSPYFIRYAADGHNAWDNTYNNPAMYSWLLKQNRQINHSDAPRFKMLSRQDYLEVFDIRYGNHGLGEDEALIVTMQDYYHPSRITLKHHDASEYELHFDVSLDRVGGIKIWFGTQ